MKSNTKTPPSIGSPGGGGGVGGGGSAGAAKLLTHVNNMPKTPKSLFLAIFIGRKSK
ncbi:hypothetical protein [Flavobacterium sp. GT3R68]|uniref:hypothetical protein n=1 Tax=Flavobacterium sp. GT3R68 TaxID=2594437 RepID=UPI0013159C33|nr:hypothetical protein [Flavobacterium sp. GT3R68]